MANGWTEERKQKQREAIKRWKPWKQSSGPKSDAGKATTAQNALKHGLRTADWLEEKKRINALLRDCRERMKRA